MRQAIVTLKKGEGRLLKSGGAWIFDNEIPDTTKIIIAQRVSSVQDADMIVVLDNGMVKDVGTHESLLASSKIYQEVYYSQQKGGEE